MEIGCFEVRDENLDTEVVTRQINEKLAELGISAKDVISISERGGYIVIRVFYRSPKRINKPPA